MNKNNTNCVFDDSGLILASINLAFSEFLNSGVTKLRRAQNRRLNVGQFAKYLCFSVKLFVLASAVSWEKTCIPVTPWDCLYKYGQYGRLQVVTYQISNVSRKLTNNLIQINNWNTVQQFETQFLVLMMFVHSHVYNVKFILFFECLLFISYNERVLSTDDKKDNNDKVQ